MKKPDTSIIISTYNSPEWLEKVLHGYNNQTYRDFEIVIADDGSGEETRLLIEKMKSLVFYPIIHVWHEDDGFQKSKILNKSIVACTTKYIIMSDGDCIPRKDFVQHHVTYREKGYFLSGGYFMLPMNISKQITAEDIYDESCFSVSWLKKNGLKSSFKNNKLNSGKLKSFLLNRLTPTRASWNGHNSSGWKKDILAVNGFDERMQYGGQDRELGERLVNSGIKSKQIRYTAVVLHLDHPRGYKNKRSIDKNLAIREFTRNQHVVRTPFGIEQKSKIDRAVSVILFSGNHPEIFQKTLWGFERQLNDNFEILVIDNSSEKKKQENIRKFVEDSPLLIRLIPKEKTDSENQVVGKAVQAATSDYLIFTDGNSIPRDDFISSHLSHRKPNHYVASGEIEISKSVFEKITKETIENQSCFTRNWLLEHGVKKSFELQKLSENKIKKSILNRVLPSVSSENQISIWKKEVLNLISEDHSNQENLSEVLKDKNRKSIQIPYSTVSLIVS